MRSWVIFVLGLLVAICARAQNPSISFVVSSQSCSEGVDTFLIAVQITNPNANATSVNINVVGGNAVFGTNYTFSPVPITFPANSPYDQFLTVVVIDDSIPDGNKFVTFGFDTSSATNNATIGSPAQFTLYMVDDDTPQISLGLTNEVQDENIGTINIPVSLNRGVRDTTKVQVKLLPTGTTAVNGVDFVFDSALIVWPPDSAGTIYATMPIINNPFYEPQRTIEVTLTNPTNGAVLTDTTFTLTLQANSLDTAQGCADLYLSQYVQSSGSNQAIQIFNPTSVPIDLSVYSILVSANAGTAFFSYNLSGTLAAKSVYVVANPNAEQGILNVANAQSSIINFDGTEAVALLHNADTIDVVGQIWANPGITGWPVGTGSTVSHTLIRSYYTYGGSADWQYASQTWNVFPDNMIDSLGFHHADSCGLQPIQPIATLMFDSLYDSIPQTAQTLSVGIIVNNPTNDTISFVVAADPALSTAVEGYAYDYVYSNQEVTAPPGINSYNLGPLYIIPSPEITPVKSIVFRFINYPGNATPVPDSVFTIYLVNNNKLEVSFLGAGYSYPKGSGRVEIPIVTTTYSSQPTTVDVSLSSGSAVLGTDFLFNDTTVTFPAFSLDTQGVWVTILNNNIYQANKQANFNLSNATNNATIGISGFTLTIINNDSLAGGITEADFDDSVNIFPNPVADKLILKTNYNLTDVEISDAVGNRVAYIGNLPSGASSVNVIPLQPGIYFLNLRADGKFSSRKFVKTE